MPELDGQVALVTGGGRGIGAEIARELAAAGMRVAVSARTRAQVEATADEIGGRAVVADVSDGDSVRGMVEDVERRLAGLRRDRGADHFHRRPAAQLRAQRCACLACGRRSRARLARTRARHVNQLQTR